MKRWVIRIFLFLLLGAIVNVAVAWGTGPVTADVIEFPSQPRTLFATHRQGWPMWSLTSQRDRNRAIFGGEYMPDPQPLVIGAWQFATRPIWPGFAINTVFYAFVLWLLFAGPFVVRRRRRIRRGLCPKCAYDLRGRPEGATACPECGAAVNRIAR